MCVRGSPSRQKKKYADWRSFGGAGEESGPPVLLCLSVAPSVWRAHPSRPAPQGPRRSTPPSRLRSRSRSRTSRRLPCSSTRVSARAVHHPCPAKLSTTMLILFCRALLGRYSVGPRIGQVRQLRHHLDHLSVLNMPVRFFLLDADWCLQSEDAFTPLGAIVSARSPLFASLHG